MKEQLSSPKQQVYLSLGSNLGDRESNLAEALYRFAPQIEILALSSVYQTEPVGYLEQPRFLNLVCQGQTRLAPGELLRYLKKIETELGRDRISYVKNGPRTIDIDILYYDDLVLQTGQLTIPHPLIQERGFVLVPLAEIAPDFLHPLLKKTSQELRQQADVSGVNTEPRPLLTGYQRDVQSESPRVALGLDRVGITELKRMIRLTSTGRPEYLSAVIDLYIDLNGDKKGAHMSRLSLAVEEALDESIQKLAPDIETLSARIAQELVKSQAASRAEVHILAQFPLSRRTPISGYRSQEIYQLIGIAAANSERCVQLIGAEAEGMTACPCAQELVRERAKGQLVESGFDEKQIARIFEVVPLATHNQRGRGSLLISAHPDIRAEELVRIIESSMSSETLDILKRPDEYFLVNRAHRNPKFVEDVVRDMLAKVSEVYQQLPDDAYVSARQTNFETIHKHNVFAERSATLGQIRREINGTTIPSKRVNLRDWIAQRLSNP
jgi:GTP cyclohydrolase IV